MFKGGLQLEDEATDFVEGREILICQAEGQPPSSSRFVVFRFAGTRQFSRSCNGCRVRASAASREAQKVDREYLEEVVEGLVRLTIPNWREVVSDGKAIRFRDDEGGHYG